MNPALKRALDTFDSTETRGLPVVVVMREKRAAMKAAMDAILAAPKAENRNLHQSESRDFDLAAAKIALIDERLEGLESSEQRQAALENSRKVTGMSGLQSAYTTSEPATYRKGDAQNSYFRDLASCRLSGDSRAAERLTRNNREVRALGNTGAVGGSGGEFAPPAWLLEEFVKLARPGRVLADRMTKQQLPAGVSSVNIPKVQTGTSTAVQTTQNTALSQTDMTTGALSSNIVTVGGKQVLSRQLIDQAGVDLDQVIMGDLAADLARQIDLQVINGSGTGGQVTGLLNVSGAQQIVYTQATPSVTGAGGLYSTINKAIAAIATTRFAPPDCIVMHPRRWSYIAAAYDSQNRPLVVPSGGAFNQIADAGQLAAEGMAGQVAGLPVYLDANLPTNLGAGTNQDPIIVAKFADLFLWESPVEMQVFEAPYADSLGVLYRAHEYLSFQGARYPASIAIINGTGQVPPVY